MFKFLLPTFKFYQCTICNLSSKEPICSICFTNLEKIPANTCNICKALTLNSSLCFSCKTKQTTFDKLHCSLNYAWPLNKILHQIKYKGNKKYANGLGFLLSQNILQITSPIDMIIPMPIHPIKYQQRGFNQVDLLLKYYIIHYGQIPIKSNIVSKIKNTKSQTTISYQQRMTNINQDHVFCIHDQINGLNILIVDDVVTTGATCNNLAKTLKMFGAKTVEVCSLMRTL